MKKIIAVLLTLFVFSLLVLYYFLSDISQTLNLFLQIFGGFIATLFGVYISLNLSNQEEYSKQKELKKNNLIESLILINGELNYNNYVLNNCINILNKKSSSVESINIDFNDADPVMRRIEDRAYYSIIGTAKFKEVINNFDLLNVLSDSYDNLKITSTLFFMNSNYIINAKKNKKHSSLKAHAIFLKICIERLHGQISINNKAIKKIKIILKQYGIGYKNFVTPKI